MRSRRAVMTVFTLAAVLLIPVGLAQAAPAPARPVSQARQTAAVPVPSPLLSYALYGKDALTRAAPALAAHGCPYGDVCMYTTSGWSHNTPEHEYYSYGCYNLSNEYGTRWIYNNQYGGADDAGFTQFGCSGAVLWTETQGGWGQFDITPVNSIKLYHP